MGTRMADEYPGIPKCLVPVAGTPIIIRQIEALKASGFDDIAVTVGHLGRQVRDALGDGAGLGVALRYLEEDRPLGTGGALAALRGRVRGDFLVILGDIVFDVDLARMLSFHRAGPARITLAVHPNDHPQDSDLVLADREGTVLGWISKRDPRPDAYPNLVNSGLYVFSPAAIEGLEVEQKLDLDRDIVVPQIRSGWVRAYRTTEYIKDAGTPGRRGQVEVAVASGLVARRNLRHRQRAVFLDRDGTLNVHRGLLHRPEALELEASVAHAVGHLNRSPYLAICITNQPVIARNLCSLDELRTIHWRLDVLLGQGGAYLDDLYFCPHHPDGGYPEERREYKIPCACRKPGIGLVKEAALRYNIDLTRSWFVGDTTTDMRTGAAAGTRTVLVATGLGGNDGRYPVRPDQEAWNLEEAVARILDEEEDS